MAFFHAHVPGGDWSGATAFRWVDDPDHTDLDLSPSISSDDLFHDLDGTSIVSRGARWALEIYGIVDGYGQRWIQVGARGSRWRSTILRTSAACGASELVEALREWLSTDLPNGATLDVN